MSKQFVSKVRNSEIAMRPILPLAQPLDLGHVGTLADDGAWGQRGTIQAILGLNSLGGELPSVDNDLRVSITSGKDVSVGFRADAKTDGLLKQFANLKGKASISFGSSNGFFLALQGLKIRQLAQPQLLVLAILNAYKAGHWEKNWVFVHQLGVAKKLTVVLSAERETTVLIQGAGKAALAAGTAVDMSAGFKFVASTKAVTQITGAKNLTAFYGAYRVRDRTFGSPTVEPVLLREQLFGQELADYPSALRAPLEVEPEKLFLSR